MGTKQNEDRQDRQEPKGQNENGQKKVADNKDRKEDAGKKPADDNGKKDNSGKR